MPESTSSAKPSTLTRRGMLLIGAAGIAAGGLGGAAWIATRDPKDLIIALLQHALPNITIDMPSAQVFAEHFMAEFYERFKTSGVDFEQLVSAAKIQGAEGVREIVGTARFAAMGPFEARAYDLSRRAVTRFLMNSNFFHLSDPTAEPIVYNFLPFGTPCTSPFADLSPPKRGDVTPIINRPRRVAG